PSVSGYFSDAGIKIRKTGSVGQLISKIIRMPKILYAAGRERNSIPYQRGYIYFQEFLPDNDFDTRITIIGNRAFGFTRNTRPDDFRASGSGDIDYDLKRIDARCIKIAFETTEKLKTQSLAFDFIFDQKNNPRIVEISYCYQGKAVYNCPGYRDREMNWHAGHVWPEDAILIDLLEAITV
ncbi:hypothetical protein MNBD_NITROSPIRAE03-2099, partial [hydrothermal vent metagenome]